jgi:phosphoglycolate phosphatase
MAALRYDLVIFDFDGTLADSNEWMVNTLNVMARRHRFRQVARDEVERLRGLSTRDVMAALKVSPWRLPFIAADMRRRSAADAASIAPFPGASETLRELADLGVTLAIVSSNGEATVRSVLGESQHLIDAYACQASLFGKASKLQRVIKRLATSPKRTLYVGDETRDIEAAYKAGTDVAAVAWGYNHRQSLERSRPTHMVDSFTDLVNLVMSYRPALKIVS